MLNIWTDGACSGNPGPGGWAFIISSETINLEGSGGSPRETNNTMELTSVIEALKATPEGSEITLTSDSKYVITGITEWIHNWVVNNWRKSDGKPVLNKDLWQLLLLKTQKRKITWIHVRGHQGHEMNEKCDKLAVAAKMNFM